MTRATVAAGVAGLLVGATWGYRQGLGDRRHAMARLEWRTAESPGAAIRRGYR